MASRFPQETGRGNDRAYRKIAKRKLILLLILFGLIFYLTDLAFASRVSTIQIGGIGVIVIVLLDAYAGLVRQFWKEFLLLFAGAALTLVVFMMRTETHPQIWWLGVGGILVSALGAVRLALLVIDSRSDDLISACRRRFLRHQ